MHVQVQYIHVDIIMQCIHIHVQYMYMYSVPVTDKLLKIPSSENHSDPFVH